MSKLDSANLLQKNWQYRWYKTYRNQPSMVYILRTQSDWKYMSSRGAHHVYSHIAWLLFQVYEHFRNSRQALWLLIQMGHLALWWGPADILK